MEYVEDDEGVIGWGSVWDVVVVVFFVLDFDVEVEVMGVDGGCGDVGRS